MIGRAHQLSVLVEIIESAALGCGETAEIVLVSGEPGVGKTRLIREAIASLAPEITVLVVNAQPGSLGRPHDVIGQLCPESSAPDRDAIAVVQAASRAADGVVVVMEDVHWADADSMFAVDQLTRQPLPNVVIVGTYRPQDLSRQLPGGDWVGRMERQHEVTQLRIDRLDRHEVAGLIQAITGSAPGSGSVEAVHRRSGGLPYVVEELVRCCGPDACVDDLLSAQLPWSLDEAVRQQLAPLDDASRRLVDTLAVLGEPSSFDVLLAMSIDHDEASLLGVLRSLTDRVVVLETSTDVFWFAHALLADAVGQQLLGRERRLLHARALDVLRRAPEAAGRGYGSSAAALARHAAGAGRFDEVPGIAREGAPAYLARGASFQALRLASQGLGEAPDDALLLRVATDAAWRLSYADEALIYADRWVRVAVDEADRMDALRFRGRIHHDRSSGDERDAVIDELVRCTETLDAAGDRRALGRACGALAQLLMLRHDGASAVTWADRAAAIAEELDDPWLRAQAAVERASSFPLSDPDEARDALLHAFELAVAVGDGILQSRTLNNLLNVVGAHSQMGGWAREQIRAIATSSGFDRLSTYALLQWEAAAAFGNADMPALRVIVRDLAAPRAEGATDGVVMHVELAMEEGRVAEVEAAVAELAGPMGEITVAHFGAAIAAVRHDREMAASALDRFASGAMVHDKFPEALLAIDLLVLALIAGASAADVRSAIDRGATAGQRDAVCRMLAGPLALADGDMPAAVAAFEAMAANELESSANGPIPMPWLATLRAERAAALAGVGRRAEAITLLEQVVGVDLARWPGWRRDRAEALLKRLRGARGARPDGELTTREREVAVLVARGFTNGQLAQELFISPKTAAVHVSNILMKLGLSGRAEVAAWAVRHGLE